MARAGDPSARARLLAAAEAVFVEHGLDHAKVEEITSRAGLSKGAFYLHFERKEDAFRELVDNVIARLMVFATKSNCIHEQAGVTAEGYLEFWLEKDAELFEFVWQNRGVMCLLLEGGRSSQYAYLVDQFLERIVENVRMHLEQGIAEGRNRSDLDVEVASVFVSGAYDRIARQVVRQPRKPDFRTVLRKVQRLVLRGIASEEFISKLDPKVISDR